MFQPFHIARRIFNVILALVLDVSPLATYAQGHNPSATTNSLGERIGELNLRVEAILFPQFDGLFPAKGWPLSGFFADDALSLPVFPVGAVPPVAWQVAVFAARFLPSLALGVIT